MRIHQEDAATICAISFWSTVLAIVGWKWFYPLFVFIMAMMATAALFFLCVLVFTLTKELFLRFFKFYVKY